MDTNIKLRHKATEQECTFDDESAVDEFLANVACPKDWAAHAASKVITVDLNELRAQLDADKEAAANVSQRPEPTGEADKNTGGVPIAVPKPAAKRAKK